MSSRTHNSERRTSYSRISPALSMTVFTCARSTTTASGPSTSVRVCPDSDVWELFAQILS